jgi:hypothetical protein
MDGWHCHKEVEPEMAPLFLLSLYLVVASTMLIVKVSAICVFGRTENGVMLF